MIMFRIYQYIQRINACTSASDIIKYAYVSDGQAYSIIANVKATDTVIYPSKERQWLYAYVADVLLYLTIFRTKWPVS